MRGKIKKYPKHQVKKYEKGNSSLWPGRNSQATIPLGIMGTYKP